MMTSALADVSTIQRAGIIANNDAATSVNRLETAPACQTTNGIPRTLVPPMMRVTVVIHPAARPYVFISLVEAIRNKTKSRGCCNPVNRFKGRAEPTTSTVSNVLVDILVPRGTCRSGHICLCLLQCVVRAVHVYMMTYGS